MYLKVYISDKTKAMLDTIQKQAIEKYAKKYKIPDGLVWAICKKESNFNTYATRIEPHLKKASWYKRTLKGIKVVQDYHHCSFGLMQIMYGTAKHIGFMGNPFSLCNPEKGIQWGVKYLSRLMNRYKQNMWDAVSAYNQGNNRKNSKGHYVNEAYVNGVRMYYKDYYNKTEH